MRKNDLVEICDRLEGVAEVLSATKRVSGIWTIYVRVEEPSPTAGYDVCYKLNGWNENDYFSILRLEQDTGGDDCFTVEIKRIKNEAENN